MKITIQDVFDLREGLRDLSAKELPISTALSVRRMIKTVNDEFQSANELKFNIIEKYKEKDLGDGRIKILDDKLETYQTEMDELMQQEVTIKLETIHIHDLNDITVKPRTLEVLNTILKEEEVND